MTDCSGASPAIADIGVGDGGSEGEAFAPPPPNFRGKYFSGKESSVLQARSTAPVLLALKIKYSMPEKMEHTRISRFLLCGLSNP